MAQKLARIYRLAKQPLILCDGSRQLVIASEGFPDVVLWNPGEQLCATLPDRAPADFRRMLCVESAAATTPITLANGDTWRGNQTLTTRHADE